MNTYYQSGMDLMAEIYANFSDEDKAWFKSTPPAAMHHSLGRHLRNYCNMWEIKWEPELIDGVDHSENHPDAISSRVIKDYQKMVQHNSN